MEKFDVKNAVIRRRSVRTFDGLPLSKAVRKDLLTFAEKLENPFKVNVRFVMLDRSSGDKKENLSTNGIINGTDLFICSAVPKTLPLISKPADTHSREWSFMQPLSESVRL